MVCGIDKDFSTNKTYTIYEYYNICTQVHRSRLATLVVSGQLSSKAELPFTALTLAEFACIGRRRWRRCTTVIADSCPTVVGGRVGAPSPFIAPKPSHFTWRSRGRRRRWYAMNIQHQISVLKCICICTTEGRASVIRQADMRMPRLAPPCYGA